MAATALIYVLFIYLFFKKRDLKIQKVSLLQVKSYSLWGAKSEFTPEQLGLVLFLNPPGSHISFNSNVYGLLNYSNEPGTLLSP